MTTAINIGGAPASYEATFTAGAATNTWGWHIPFSVEFAAAPAEWTEEWAPAMLLMIWSAAPAVGVNLRTLMGVGISIALMLLATLT